MSPGIALSTLLTRVFTFPFDIFCSLATNLHSKLESYRAELAQTYAQQSQPPPHIPSTTSTTSSSSASFSFSASNAPTQSSTLNSSLHSIQQQQQQNISLPQQSPAPSIAHRYEYGSSKPSSLTSPSTHTSPTRTSVTSTTADPLRAQWQQLQQELHGNRRTPGIVQPGPVVGSPARSVHPTHSYHPSPVRSAHTSGVAENVMDPDWSAVLDDVASKQQAQQDAQQRVGRAHHASWLEASPAMHVHGRPTRTPMTEKLSKAVMIATGSPSRHAPHPHPYPQYAPSSSSSSTVTPAIHDQAQVLQRASSLFRDTLHEMEEKAHVLQTLLAAFKEAGMEMDANMNLQQQQQQQQPSYRQQYPQPSQQQYQQRYMEQNGYEQPESVYHQKDRDTRPQNGYGRSSSQVLPTPPVPHRQSRPRVAFVEQTQTQKPRPRSASQVGTRSNGTHPPPPPPPTSIRAASASRTSVHRPIPGTATRPASAATPAVASRPAAAATVSSRPATFSTRRASGISGAPAAMSYPRPRTASARAARSGSNPGVAAAKARIKAILDKTKPAKMKGVNAITHPNIKRPSRDALVEEPQARGGVRRASVQEVLVGAAEIAARKSTPIASRPRVGSRPPAVKSVSRGPKDPADEYEFQPSTDSHPHHPLSNAEAARLQTEASIRLTTHAGIPPHTSIRQMQHPHSSPQSRYSYSSAAPSPSIQRPNPTAAVVDPSDEFGSLLSAPEPSLLDDSYNYDDENEEIGLNTTAGLIKQEERAQARHGPHLQAYLEAINLPGNHAEKNAALAALAAKALHSAPPSSSPQQHIYASPLRTHSAAAYQQRQAQQREQHSMSYRANPIVRGSSANNSLPTQPVQRVSGMAGLEIIMQRHNVPLPTQ
jgi:hypothetical protein